MRTNNGFKNLTVAVILTLVGHLTLTAATAGATPVMAGGAQHSLPDHEIDFWFNGGELTEVDIPRWNEPGDVFIDSGNLDYPTPESFFSGNTMEIVDDGDTVVFTIEGLNYEFRRLGTLGGHDWWNVSGDRCEWEGDMGSCTLEHLGVMVTKDIDFAGAMEVFAAEYDPAFVEEDDGKGLPLIFTLVVPTAVIVAATVIAIVAAQNGSDVNQP